MTKLNRGKITAAAETLARLCIPATGACNLTPGEWGRLCIMIDYPLSQEERVAVCEELVEIERQQSKLRARVMAAGGRS